MNAPEKWRLIFVASFVVVFIAFLVYLSRIPSPQSIREPNQPPASPTRIQIMQIQQPTPDSAMQRVFPTVPAAIQPTLVFIGTPTLPEPLSSLLKEGELGTIYGSVIDEASQPVHGAEVKLQKKTGTGFLNMSVITDQKGHFSFPGLQPAGYQLIARKEYYMTSPDSAQLIESKHTFESVTIVLQHLKFAIRGTVRDRVTKNGISGLSVVLLKENPQFNRREFRFPDDILSRSTTTDSGSYEFLPVVPGSYVITFADVQSATCSYYIYNQITDDRIVSPPGRFVTLVDRDMERIDLEAGGMPKIMGTILNPAGDRIAGATVSDTNAVSRVDSHCVVSDERGQYEIPFPHLNSESNLYLKLYAYHPQHGLGNVDVLDVFPGEARKNVDIVLQKVNFRIFGTITVNGKPPQESFQLEYNNNVNNSLVQVKANAADYQITGLSPGTTELWVKDDRFEDFYTQVDIRETQPETQIDIDVKKKDNFEISGTVSDINGNPLENVAVLARRWYQKVSRATTDVDGTYRLTDLQSGPHDLYFEWKGDRKLEYRLFEIEAGSKNVNVTLGGTPYSISGRVLLEDGRPFTSYSGIGINLYRAENPLCIIHMVDPDPEGNFNFDLYQPGRYFLAMGNEIPFETENRKLIGLQEFTIEENSPSNQPVDLFLHQYPNLVTMRGLFMESENTRMPWFMVQLVGDPSLSYFPSLGFPGGNGVFYIIAQPGQYNLRFYSPHYDPYEVPITVERDIQNVEDWVIIHKS